MQINNFLNHLLRKMNSNQNLTTSNEAIEKRHSIAINPIYISILLAEISALFLNVKSFDFPEYVRTFDSFKFHHPYPSFEYIFWGIIEALTTIGTPYHLAIFFIFIGTIHIKIIAIKKLSSQSTWPLIFIYISIFFLLHECTQLRIACGLSFSLFSCHFIIEKKYYLALFLACISVGFHITAPLLTFIFFLCFSNSLFQRIAIIFSTIGAALFLLKASIIFPLMSSTMLLLGGRYIDYTNKLIAQGQNKSGLVFVYAFFVLGILILLKIWAQKNITKLPPSFNALLATSIYGIGVIFWLYETVAIGSRLSDVLLITIVPVIAIFIANTSFFYKTAAYSALGLFFLARIYQLFPFIYMLS